MRSCLSMVDVSIIRRAFSLEIAFCASLLLFMSENVQSQNSFWMAPFCLSLWELLQIRVPDHNLADTVVSAMEAPYLHVELVPECCHHRELVNLSVYVPLS